MHTKTEKYLERARNQRREEIFDTGFYVAVCFETRAQKEAWLRANGFDPQAAAIHGLDLVERLGQSVDAPVGIDLDTRARPNLARDVIDELAEPLPER